MKPYGTDTGVLLRGLNSAILECDCSRCLRNGGRPSHVGHASGRSGEARLSRSQRNGSNKKIRRHQNKGARQAWVLTLKGEE